MKDFSSKFPKISSNSSEIKKTGNKLCHNRTQKHNEKIDFITLLKAVAPTYMGLWGMSPPNKFLS